MSRRLLVQVGFHVRKIWPRVTMRSRTSVAQRPIECYVRVAWTRKTPDDLSWIPITVRWNPEISFVNLCSQSKHQIAYVMLTKLPSNLRPTIRECVHLVTRGYFWSRDNMVVYTVRSAIAENPMLHANFMDPCFIETGLWPIKVLHSENAHFRPFCSCDLVIDPVTFIYELYPYSLEIHRMC